MSARRCEIAEYPTATFTAPAPPCGRGASYWSDDLQDGATVYVCDEHAREIRVSTDAELHEVSS